MKNLIELIPSFGHPSNPENVKVTFHAPAEVLEKVAVTNEIVEVDIEVTETIVGCEKTFTTLCKATNALNDFPAIWHLQATVNMVPLTLTPTTKDINPFEGLEEVEG